MLYSFKIKGTQDDKEVNIKGIVYAEDASDAGNRLENHYKEVQCTGITIQRLNDIVDSKDLYKMMV